MSVYTRTEAGVGSWEVDKTSCWPRCETGTSILMFDPAGRRTVMVPISRDRLKDCDECRARVWERRQGRWLHHLWVEDDPMWVARGLTSAERPAQLWVGEVSQRSDRKVRETRNAREKATGVAIDYFRVVSEDGRVLLVAAEDLSPRERLLVPCPPAEAWERLRGGYTGSQVRRHKGRSMSKRWEVPSWFVGGGPIAKPARLRTAMRRAGFDDWEIPEGVSWPVVAAAIEAELARVSEIPI